MKLRINTTFGGDDYDGDTTFIHTSETARETEEELEEEDIYDDDEETHVEGNHGDYNAEEQPVWTFRAVYLGSLSCLFSFVLNKFFLYQTAQCIMSMVTFVAILYPMGYAMAKFMPKRRVYLRTFGLEFSLNPGPFDTREFVLMCILANTGAAYGGITSHSVHNRGL